MAVDERIAIKYRPHNLKEMRGQDENLRILRQQIKNNNLPKAMLLWGIRGTGKTTTARMIAEWVNCENPSEDGPCGCCRNCTAIRTGGSFDVIELDAASNNKVEDMTRLIKEIEPIPSQMKKRVVILDEVHRLSKSPKLEFRGSTKIFTSVFIARLLNSRLSVGRLVSARVILMFMNMWKTLI